MAGSELQGGQTEHELLAHSADVLVEVGLDGRIVYASQAVEAIVGRSAEAVRGVSFVELIAPEFREEMAAAFQKVVETGAQPTLRFDATRPDGSRASLEAIVRVFRDDEDRQRIVASCRDLTQQIASGAVEQQRGAFHRALVEASPEPAAIVDVRGDLLYANRSFQQHFGREKSIRALGWQPGPLGRFSARREGARPDESDSAATLEVDSVDADGRVRWFSIRWHGFEEDDGSPLFALTLRDVTKRKRLEEALRGIASPALFGRLDSAATLLAAVAEVLGLERIVFARVDGLAPERAQVLAGWDAGQPLAVEELDVSGLPDAPLTRGEVCIHPAGLRHLMPGLRDRLGRDFDAYAGVPIVRADGSLFGFVGGYGLRPLADVELTRSLLRLFAAHHSARESRARSDETLRESQARFDTIVRHSSDLLLEIDATGSIRYVSPACVTVLGRTTEQLVGLPLSRLVDPDDRERLEEAHREVLSGHGFASVRFRVERSDETLRSIEADALPFRAADDSMRMLLLAHDVTERDETEQALRETELRLGQAQKMESVGRLAVGIAHDFNNLLTAIIGYGDLLLDELSAEHAVRRDAEEILAAAERAAALTRQLLAFSRHEARQTESLDLNAVLANIDRMIRRLLPENIEVVTVQHGTLSPVEADRGQLEQLIVNLVVNARDAMPRGGRLEFETRDVELREAQDTPTGALEPGRYVVLRVRDDGVGMDAAIQDHLFEPFFTTKERGAGTGLGLATAREMVLGWGGRIDVASALGEGTTFSIYLPTSHRSEAPGETDGNERVPRGDETILLVEDSAPVRGLLERTLRRSGYRVLAAGSATAALRHCARHEGPIDLLLSDVVLPKLSGPEVAARARGLRPELRVLYMSGFDRRTLEEGQGMDLGEVPLLQKPLASATVLSEIRRALDAAPET